MKIDYNDLPHQSIQTCNQLRTLTVDSKINKDLVKSHMMFGNKLLIHQNTFVKNPDCDLVF